MNRPKYLLTILLASLLSLASCGSTPTPTDPGGNPPSGGGGENPPAETEEKVTIVFSSEYHSTQNFTTLTKGSFTIQAYKGYYGQTAPQYVESAKQLKLYASNELIISGTSVKYIEFDMTTYKDATIYLTKGTFDKSTGIWTGDTDSVKFTIGTGGQFGITTLKISNTIPTDPGGGSTPGGGGGTGGDPVKVTVPAHSLSDSNPPITIGSKGQTVTETTWNSFKNGGQSKFNGNYNFTYWYYVGGSEYTQAFTKDGYYYLASYNKYYYERKSGNTFYYYAPQTNYQRQETTLNLTDKYTQVIYDEVRLHMFEFSNYEFDSKTGEYTYYGNGYTSTVMFQNGYLTYLYYTIPSAMAFYEIKLSFETTITIPESFYYQ